MRALCSPSQTPLQYSGLLWFQNVGILQTREFRVVEVRDFPIPGKMLMSTYSSPAQRTNFSASASSRAMPYTLASNQCWIPVPQRSIHGNPSKRAACQTMKAMIRCENGDEGDLNRRQLLLASSTSLGLAGLHLNSAGKGFSLPMPPPDLSLCHKPTLPEGATATNCCPPYSATAVEFQFPTDLPMRIRQSAHTVDEEYIEKFSEAMQLMRDLPSDDPRSFTQQADIHCAYCDAAYYTGSLPLQLNVHNSWFFLPWHRWYLYFYERILGKLIEDDSFAIPFWNWDADSLDLGLTIPPIFVKEKPLYDSLRDALHQPPTPIDLSFDGTDKTQTLEESIAANMTLMYRQIVSGAKTASLFQGQPYRYGDTAEPGAGTLENSPHSEVHVWSGDRTQPNGENMGNFYSAGRDPVFYAHHANVDRCWTIWKTLDGGKRKDYTDKDFLNSRFLFYDENAQLVEVKVSDALDPSRLRYTYQKAPIPWLSKRPTSKKKTLTVAFSAAGGLPQAALAADDIPEFGTQAKKLAGPLTFRVKRPKAKRSESEKEESEEVLVIEGIEVKRDRATKFDVFINLPEADSTTPLRHAEYAGSFVNVPHHEHQEAEEVSVKKKKGEPKAGFRRSSFRVGISEILEDLDASEDESIVVTLVPKGNISVPIKISGIKIEYD